jgi:hypothetical protein
VTVLDALMAEYHLPLAEAMEFPLEAYLALVPALVARHGGRVNGPDYIDQAAMAARERAWEFLRTHFEILPQGQPGPTNALARWMAARRF